MKKVLITLSYNSETRCWFRCFHLNVNSHNTKQRLSRTDAVITERVTGRKPRGPQVAGEYKLQVADSAPLHSVLLKTNLFVFVFFSFLKPWADNGSTNLYSCRLLWPGMTHFVHPISKMHIVREGPAETPSAVRCSFYLIRSSRTDIETSNRGTLCVPF